MPNFQAIDSIGSRDAARAMSKSEAMEMLRKNMPLKPSGHERKKTAVSGPSKESRITRLSLRQGIQVVPHQPSWQHHELEVDFASVKR